MLESKLQFFGGGAPPPPHKKMRERTREVENARVETFRDQKITSFYVDKIPEGTQHLTALYIPSKQTEFLGGV